MTKSTNPVLEAQMIVNETREQFVQNVTTTIGQINAIDPNNVTGMLGIVTEGEKVKIFASGNEEQIANMLLILSKAASSWFAQNREPPSTETKQ